MRVVLDTNVVSSALLWGGTPERLIEFAGEGSIELFTSEIPRRRHAAADKGFDLHLYHPIQLRFRVLPRLG